MLRIAVAIAHRALVHSLPTCLLRLCQSARVFLCARLVTEYFEPPIELSLPMRLLFAIASASASSSCALLPPLHRSFSISRSRERLLLGALVHSVCVCVCACECVQAQKANNEQTHASRAALSSQPPVLPLRLQ